VNQIKAHSLTGRINLEFPPPLEMPSGEEGEKETEGGKEEDKELGPLLETSLLKADLSIPKEGEEGPQKRGKKKGERRGSGVVSPTLLNPLFLVHLFFMSTSRLSRDGKEGEKGRENFEKKKKKKGSSPTSLTTSFCLPRVSPREGEGEQKKKKKEGRKSTDLGNRKGGVIPLSRHIPPTRPRLGRKKGKRTLRKERKRS